MTPNQYLNRTKHSIFKILWLCIAVAVFSVSATGVVFAEERENMEIVAIDTNRILESHPAFLRAQQIFQDEIQQMEEQLQEMGEEERMLAQQMMQQQLQQRGQELQMDALDEVREDVAKVAKEKGYKYVVDANALIVGGADVTEEVMEALELE